MERQKQKLVCRNPCSLGRRSGCGLHLPGQTTSGGSRLFFRYICIFGGFTSTKVSLNLLQWPRESSINKTAGEGRSVQCGRNSK